MTFSSICRVYKNNETKDKEFTLVVKGIKEGSGEFDDDALFTIPDNFSIRVGFIAENVLIDGKEPPFQDYVFNEKEKLILSVHCTKQTNAEIQILSNFWDDSRYLGGLKLSV